MEEQTKQKTDAEIIKELDFALQKFLLRTSVIEGEQKILGAEMERLLQGMRLKKVYHNIITKH